MSATIMEDFDINRSPASQWTDTQTDYMLRDSDYPLFLKANILFYRNILWINNKRNSFNCIRNYSDSRVRNDAHARSFFRNYAYYEWNDDLMSDTSILKWFPLSMFPNGPDFDEDSQMLKAMLRATLDELVETFFRRKEKLVMRKDDMGLGYHVLPFFPTISMTGDVADNTIGCMLYKLLYYYI